MGVPGAEMSVEALTTGMEASPPVKHKAKRLLIIRQQ